MRKLILLLALGAMMAAACQHDTLLHTYLPVEGRQWLRSDTAVFALPEMEETGSYDLTLGLRIGSCFPYQSVYVLVEQRLTNPVEVRRDTLCLQLADAEGHLRENGITLLQHEEKKMLLYFRKGQTGEIRVSHLMHRDPLPEVSDVGIMLQPTQH